MRLRLLLLGRAVALHAAALGHGARLLRLGLANARALKAYAREAGDIAGRPRRRGRGRSLHLPLARYLSLFRPYPAIESAEEAAERERLGRTYAEVLRLCERRPPRVDPVEAPSARALQGAVMRRAFGRLFGLRLAPEEAAALGGYGSVPLAARDFLEYCGAAAGLAPAAPLALQLPGFALEAELRHRRVASRGRAAVLTRRSAALGDLRALWHRLTHVVARAYWARGDARARLKRMALQVQAQQAERLQAVRLMSERFDRTAQDSLLLVLADQMHLRAALALAALASEARETAEARDLALGRLAALEVAFLNATRQLERNQRAAVGR